MRRVGIATGAGRGMGRDCAVRMAELVDLILLVDIDAAAVTETASALRRDSDAAIEAVVLDVTDAAALQDLAERVSHAGVLRAVSHAAGISPSMADWRRVLIVDLVGSAMLLDALFPLATTGTAVVCFASMAPWLATPALDEAARCALDTPLDLDFLDRLHAAVGPAIKDSGLAYSWAKLGVRRLVEREAVRFGRSGARVCALSPGLIDTPMGQLEFAERPVKSWLLEQTPLGRTGRADEISAAVRFLLSDEASFINGIDLLVDGGTYAAVRTTGGSLPGRD